MRFPGRGLAPVLAAAGALALPSTAAADQVIAQEARLTAISGWGDYLAWSTFDQASGRYALVLRRAGQAPVRVPVPTRGAPFDVDLGPDFEGDLNAVYSRCKQYALLDRSPWTGGQKCDLYRYDFGSRRETKIAAANSSRGSETLPTIWKEDVAFVRAYPDGERAIYVRPTVGTGRSVRLPGGPRCPRDQREKGCIAQPNSLELYGRRLAYGWDVSRAGGFVSSMRLLTIRRRGPLVVGGSIRRVAIARPGGASVAQLFAPGFKDGRLHFGGRRRGATTGFSFFRTPVSRLRLEAADAPTILTSTAVDSRGTAYVQADDVYLPPACNNFTERDLKDPGCTIARASGLKWQRVGDETR